MLFAEECWSRTGSFAPSIRGLKDETSSDQLWQLFKVLEQTKGEASTYLVALLVSWKEIHRLVEGRVWRDGDAGEALESTSRKDVNLDTGAVEGGIGRRGGAMEDEDWQISKVRIGGIVETDLVLRQGQLVRDSDHFEFCR